MSGIRVVVESSMGIGRVETQEMMGPFEVVVSRAQG
jgi:hypothetical protein